MLYTLLGMTYRFCYGVPMKVWGGLTMSYVVCHIQKFKSGDVKGLQIHNQRERDYSKNKDIDRSKSELNYDLHNNKNINYNRRVKEILEEGYKGKRSVRKDAVILTSTLVSSDGDFFKNLSEEEQRKFFEESYEYFKQRYGESNIVSAVVHMDETTPHMHLCAVPLTSDGRLSGKDIINRNTLKKIQDELPKRLQSKGFTVERGKDGSEAKHIEIHKFKRETYEKLSEELDMKVEKYNKLAQSVLERNKDLEGLIGLVENLKPKKTLLGSNYTISKTDYDTLKVNAEIGQLHIVKNQELKNKIAILEKDNEKLRSSIDNSADLLRQISELRRLNRLKDRELKAMKKIIEKHNLLKELEKEVSDKVKSLEKDK